MVERYVHSSIFSHVTACLFVFSALALHLHVPFVASTAQTGVIKIKASPEGCIYEGALK